LAETETSEYRRKFLVVVDDTPECDRAITFAAYRVRRTGGAVVLLSVIEPIESQQWLGVEEVLKAEARDRAEALLDQRIARIAKIGNIRTETVIREGRAPEAIEQLVGQDKAIAILVLAASRSGEGPGPLISAFATRSMGTALPVLITIVPAAMSDQDIIDVT
jgi:nucleotide-binding universal stress UspA family protein